jgi:hypothetical protein
MSEARQKKESLEEEVDHVVEEARMVLPGIQALLGFQLVAVFNQRFAERLPFGALLLHHLSAPCQFWIAIWFVYPALKRRHGR